MREKPFQFCHKKSRQDTDSTLCLKICAISVNKQYNMNEVNVDYSRYPATLIPLTLCNI